MGSNRGESKRAGKNYVALAGFCLLAALLVVSFFFYMGRNSGESTTETKPSGNENGIAYGQMNLDLPAPMGLTVTMDKGAAIRWADDQDPEIIGYNVYRYVTADDPGTKINMAAMSDTIYFDDEGNVFSTYAVSAVDSNGKEGPLCAPVAAALDPSTLEGLNPTARAEAVENADFGEPRPQPELPVGIVDCTAEGMGYSGVWYLESYSEVTGGTLMVTPYSGNSVSYSFAGDTVMVIAARHWNYGIMDVYIDDELWQSVDLYDPGLVVRETVFTGIGLGPGTHSIKLVCSGQKNPKAGFTLVNLEALEIE